MKQRLEPQRHVSRIGRLRAALPLGLALSLAACGAATPEVEVPDEQDENTDQRAARTPIEVSSLFDGVVRSASLRVAASADRVVVGYDTVDGEVWLGPEPQTRIAERAQLGCLHLDDEGHTWVATLERKASSPAVELVVRQLDANYELVGGRTLTSTAPRLWPDPGARCAFVPQPDGGGFPLVALRAREAEPAAALDLWLARLDDQASVPMELGRRVPTIVADAPVAYGAILAVQDVVDDAEGSRAFAWRFVGVDARFDAEKAFYRLRTGAPLSSPPILASEARSVLLGWVEKGQGARRTHMVRPHASLTTRVLPRANEDVVVDLSELPPQQMRRTDVVEPIKRNAPPRATFLDGSWWVVAEPETYAATGKREPAPYRERLIAVDEGNAVVRLLPPDVHGTRLVETDAGVFMLGTGAPVEDQPGFASGVRMSSEAFDVNDIELARPYGESQPDEEPAPTRPDSAAGSL